MNRDSVLARRIRFRDNAGNELQHSWAVGSVVVWKLRPEQMNEGRQWAACDPCPEHLWLMETADRREAFRMAHERNAEMHPVAATEGKEQ
jgi:hypothetical protein